MWLVATVLDSTALDSETGTNNLVQLQKQL